MPSRTFPLSELRLTVRGYGAVAIAIIAVGMAWLFGARALQAVAAPAVVGLLAGAIQVLLASEPTVERTVPSSDFPGATETVSVRVEGGTTVVGVADTVEGRLSATGNEQSIAPPGTLSYGLEYTGRGVHTLGPTTVTLGDVFGLVERRVTVGETDTVVVYPQVYSLAGSEDLSVLLARALTPERQEFDTLREYVPGDPLRDIHWKSSAKRPEELIVKEFAGREPQEVVTIAATAQRDGVDAMASATASLAMTLLEAGLTVSVTVPKNSLVVGGEHADRTALLTMLARTENGQVKADTWEEADITVQGTGGQATVTVAGHTTDFESVRTGAGAPLSAALSPDSEVSAT